MKLLNFKNILLAGLCALVISVTVTAPKVEAASIPTLGTKLYYMLGNVLFGGLISRPTSTDGTTGVAGYAVTLPEFATSTTLRPVTGSISSVAVYKEIFTAYGVGTGSTTIKYGGVCFRSPLGKIAASSGVLLRLDFHMGRNPANIGGDIGIVANCTDHTLSGSNIIDNVNTASGAITSYTTGTLQVASGAYIKYTPRGNMTAGATYRITGELLNVWGE